MVVTITSVLFMIASMLALLIVIAGDRMNRPGIAYVGVALAWLVFFASLVFLFGVVLPKVGLH